MAKCLLCGQRLGKRYCPAKGTKICSICCGTKREIEIDCPSDCVHLQKGRSFQAQRRSVPQVPPPRQFSEQFFHRYAGVITAAAAEILEERGASSGMVDQDVLRALNALTATMKTLDAGIYYETLPEGSTLATPVYRRLKKLFETLMQPGGADREALRIAEVLEVLQFMGSMGELYAGDRPRSRRYLDWLSTMMPEAAKQQSGRLIVP